MCLLVTRDLEISKAWKKYLNKGDFICVILMDLSKAFDTINYNLPPAKLEVSGHGFS